MSDKRTPAKQSPSQPNPSVTKSTAPPKLTSSFAGDLAKFPVKVNNGSLADIKIALDDMVVKFLNQELAGVIKQSHRQTDLYLWCQLLLNVIGGGVALYSYLTPFQQCRFVLGVSCASYFAISLVLGFYFLFFGTSHMFEGHVIKSGEYVTFTTIVDPPSSLYHITATRSGRKTPSTSTTSSPTTWTLEWKKPVEAWFDVTGTLAADLFASDMKEWTNALLKRN